MALLWEWLGYTKGSIGERSNTIVCVALFPSKCPFMCIPYRDLGAARDIVSLVGAKLLLWYTCMYVQLPAV